MEDVSPVMTCVSGPDTGRQFAIKGGATTLGTGAGCHVESADPVLTGMQVTFTLADGRVTFEATDADVVEVDGVAQTIGAVRPGQQVRIGTSIWQLADEDAARQFAGFLGRVGGHIGAAAGLGRVEGFSVREMFSEVFKRHPDEEVDAYFSIGSPATTPSLADLGTAWPRPWVLARGATLSVLIYRGVYFAIG